MRVDISKITNAVSKVSALTSDIKAVPGILLNIIKNEGDSVGTLEVCFSDGHKSVIEKIDVEVEDTDYVGGIIVGYEQFTRAIQNCQPSGIIKVGTVQIIFKENNIITVCADQFMNLVDAEGNSVGDKKMASKKMDVAWVLPNSDMKVGILSRMKYQDIFDAKDGDGNTIEVDTFDKKELIDALSRTSVEKGKQLYISTKTQNIFVSNQAHLTSVPVSGYEISEDDKAEIAGTLSEQGIYSEETFKEACAKKSNRINFSVSLSQAVAKSIIDILNKTSADTVSLYAKDKCCNIFIDSDDEKVGIWFEMTPASKIHLGALERYNSLGYKTYQMMFIRDFLVDMIKSALNNTKSEKVEIKFSASEDEMPSSPLDMIIFGGSSASSTSDVYRINPDSLVDSLGDLQTKTFKVSLKVLSDMIAQVKTTRVALDFNVAEDGSVCIRLCEIDDEQLSATYTAMRNKAKEVVEASGQPFDMATTPTPVEVKQMFDMRNDRVVRAKQYTILAN